jgi:hypothetical protein
LTPPGGWWYVQRETLARLTDMSLAGLAGTVIEHRRHKGLGPLDAEAVALEIERQICQRLGECDCVREGPGDGWVPMQEGALFPSLDEISRATTAGIEWLRGGGGFVSEAEWRRRAGICMGCQLNSPVAGCKCGAVYKAVESAIPKERRREGLWICGACRCSLNVKTNLPADVVRASNEGAGLVFPQGCWQNEIVK